MDVLRLSHIHKTYYLGRVPVPALSDITLEVQPDRFTVLSGPSGSGKTTLLNLIGCIDAPDRGEIDIGGRSVISLSDDAMSDFRLRNIGFIFQNFNLIPVLTAYENIEYPLILTHAPERQRRQRVTELLEAVGLTQQARHWPGQLSGGQRQRVAIARALAVSPQLVLADEPTANLDTHTGASIIALMRSMQHEYHVTFVFSSHDPNILLAADDAVFLQDGRITSVEHRQLAGALQ